MKREKVQGKLINANNYEFIVVQNLYDEDEDGNPVLVKRNVKSRYTCPITDISSVEQTITNKGGIYKDRCTVYTKDRGAAVVQDNYDKIRDLISNKTIVRGFKG